MRLMMAAWSFLGRILHDLEDTVDAVAQAEAFFERFQVNIARAHAIGFEDDEVHHLDDGGVNIGGVFGALIIVIGVGFDLKGVALVIADEGVDGFVDGAVVAFDGFVDLDFGDDDAFDFQFENVLEGVDGLEVVGVADGQAEGFALALDGHDVVAVDEGLGDGVDGLVVDAVDVLDEG